MRFTLLFFVCATALAIPAHVNSNPVHMIEVKLRDDPKVINREFMDALKEIDATKNAMKKTVILKHDEAVDNKHNGETFSQGIHSFFDEIFDVLKHPQKYVFGRTADENKQGEADKTVRIASNGLAHENTNPTTTAHNGLVDKTRDELKKDIEVLHEYLFKIRAEFDEWMVSNKHQNFKSMVIGATSAIVVLIVYYILCKCCTRRSRLNHLSSFANDHFASKCGDNESLLPSKRNRRFPSNSEEDI